VRSDGYGFATFQRACAARFAMSLRSLGLKAAALAFPPFRPPRRPSVTAAGFFRRLGRVPVAVATTRAASWLLSSLLLERLGMCAQY